MLPLSPLPGASWVSFCCSAGLGQIDYSHLEKLPPALGMVVVKIGGPAYRIGMGGGAASSVPSGGREGGNAADLDFNAVQVMAQRRAGDGQHHDNHGPACAEAAGASAYCGQRCKIA